MFLFPKDLEWVAGVIVVSAMVLAILAVASLGSWDLLRQYRGVNIAVTASTWLARFAVRHPFACFCSGFALGALLAHLWWFQNPPTFQG